MKFATALIDADEPSSESVLPLRTISLSQRFSVRDTVLATMSSNSCPPVRSRCSCSMVETLCCKTTFCFSNISTCCLVCSRSAFCAARRLISAFSLLSWFSRSEEHTSELQSHLNLVCRLLLEKKNNTTNTNRQFSPPNHHIP